MHFSLEYFNKLKQELESAGYEVTFDRKWGIWESSPVGAFFVTSALKGESFCFVLM
jgi:hypothetical protein